MKLGGVTIMRLVKTTKENNLIRLHFDNDKEKAEQLSPELQIEPSHEAKTTCEGGVCSLNWAPVRPIKKSEAA